MCWRNYTFESIFCHSLWTDDVDSDGSWREGSGEVMEFLSYFEDWSKISVVSKKAWSRKSKKRAWEFPNGDWRILWKRSKRVFQGHIFNISKNKRKKTVWSKNICNAKKSWSCHSALSKGIHYSDPRRSFSRWCCKGKIWRPSRWRLFALWIRSDKGLFNDVSKI